MIASTLPVGRYHDVVEQDAAERAWRRLRTAPRIAAREITCQYHSGVLVLDGRVQSYYEKQLAQEAVAGLEGVTLVVNRLEVTWDRTNLQRRPAR